MRLLLLCTAMLFAAQSFSWDNPKTIAVNNVTGELAVGLDEGIISIMSSSTFKMSKSYQLMTSVEALCYDKEGKFLWVHGREIDGGEGLFCYDATTFEKVFEKEADESVFNLASNKVCYKKDYFAAELTVLNLTSHEKIGVIKMNFTNKDAKVKMFGFSSDGASIIALESKTNEMCVFKGEGFISAPDKRFTATGDIPSTSFGYGMAVSGEDIVIAGWSKTMRLTGGVCAEYNRNETGGYKFCHSFCSFPSGEKFLIMSDNGGYLYNTADLNYSKITIDEVEGVAGNVKGIATADGETFFFVTDDYVIGKINKEGFCTASSFMDYTVDVVLRDSYKEEKAKEIQEGLKANKFKVEVPATYDKENPVVIKAGVSLKEAYKIIKALRGDARIQTVVRVNV